jgi:hypothetical protein
LFKTFKAKQMRQELPPIPKKPPVRTTRKPKAVATKAKPQTRLSI